MGFFVYMNKIMSINKLFDLCMCCIFCLTFDFSVFFMDF